MQPYHFPVTKLILNDSVLSCNYDGSDAQP